MDTSKISIEEHKAGKNAKGQFFNVSYESKEFVLALNQKKIVFFSVSSEFRDYKGRPKVSLSLELDEVAALKIQSVIETIVKQLPEKVQALKVVSPLRHKDGYKPSFSITVSYDGTDESMAFDFNGKVSPSLKECLKTMRWGARGNFVVQFKDVFVSNGTAYVRAFLRKASNIELPKETYTPVAEF